MKWTLLAVVLGFLMDLCFGDPRWLYHPVRIIGHGITFLEKILRKIFPKTKTGERIAGGLLVVGIVAASSFVPWLILHLAYGFLAGGGAGELYVLPAAGGKIPS